jgi:hydrogenase expression/formation protein HypC
VCLAVPGRIEAIAAGAALTRVGRVSFGGVVKEVSLAYVPEARVGDYVLVHVGFAIGVVDAAEAERTLALLETLEEPAEEDER